MKKIIPLLVLIPFTLVSLECAVRGGVEGLAVFREPWALQVLLDLCVATFLVGAWMRKDARAHGISALPFLVMLPLLGSVAALAYLVRRNWGTDTQASIIAA